jgi:hypothetical protein
MIHLHLGAHKCATTYIQGRLVANREFLGSVGVSQVPVATFRPWRRAALAGNAKTARDPAVLFNRALAEWIPRDDPIVLVSDENMLGSPFRIVREGRLYPELRAKLGRAAPMFEGRELALFISIRRYDSFYAAIYCEALRHGERANFKEFVTRLDPRARRWPDILADIVALFPASPITIWPYEQLQEEEGAIFNALTGRDVANSMNLTGDIVRPSMSQRAVDTIERLEKLIGWFATKRLVACVDWLLPKNRGHAAFDPWTNEQKSELSDLYREDLAALKGNPRYTMLGSAGLWADQLAVG